MTQPEGHFFNGAPMQEICEGALFHLVHTECGARIGITATNDFGPVLSCLATGQIIPTPKHPVNTPNESTSPCERPLTALLSHAGETDHWIYRCAGKNGCDTKRPLDWHSQITRESVLEKPESVEPVEPADTNMQLPLCIET